MQDAYFTSVRSATHTHYVDRLPKYRLIVPPASEPVSGLFVLNDDIQKAPVKDKKAEAMRLLERQERLTQKHGTLPQDWERHDDAVLARYFHLQGKVSRGELIDLCKLSVLPSDNESANNHSKFENWLVQQKQVVTCPVTGENYVKDIKTMDELAGLPGFVDLLTEVYGDKSFLARLFMSEKVRALLLSNLI
jgi:hypothetical protein